MIKRRRYISKILDKFVLQKIFFHIAEIFDAAGVCKDGVRKLRKKKFVLVSPTVNSGEKERLQLRNFVLTGRPRGHRHDTQAFVVFSC